MGVGAGIRGRLLCSVQLMPDLPTIAEFRTRFPELTTAKVSDDNAQLAINAALQFHDQTTEGMLLCAAHLATSSGLVEILQSSQGPLVTTFKAFDDGTFWATTSYGRQFREYEKRLTPVMMVV